ncbi:MAG: CoA transferase, partial [Acidimicrobiales bacterium]
MGSVVAGLLAAQGAIALALGRARGGHFSSVCTSAVHAALLTVSQYVARATCLADHPSGPPRDVPGPRGDPPFATSDGRWVEIETLSAPCWALFWGSLGLTQAVIASAWKEFLPRYSRARCALPADLHTATARRTTAELRALAAQTGMSLVPVRGHAEVRFDPEGWSDRPRIDESPAGRSLASPLRVSPAAADGLPLAGLVVVESTSRIQGPLAGRLLSLLGARVIRVEPPGGDGARMADPLAGDLGAFFLAMNRGKEAVEVDLACPSGRSELLDLVSGADVFLHNWRPGKDGEWSLEAKDLWKMRPGLVYCEASGWGDHAPPGSPLGMDYLVQAHSGLGEALACGGDPPVPSRVLLADVSGALLAREGVLQGLWLLDRDGHGRLVRTSLLSGAMALQAHRLDQGSLSVRAARQGVLAGPWGEPLCTMDGYLVLDPPSSPDERREILASS